TNRSYDWFHSRNVSRSCLMLPSESQDHSSKLFLLRLCRGLALRPDLDLKFVGTLVTHRIAHFERPVRPDRSRRGDVGDYLDRRVLPVDEGDLENCHRNLLFGYGPRIDGKALPT